ncbi:YozE family protein [Bacillus andreraoultii]|uniref:YozE family protein n=1 Tax=Bacillus andreraoultii TaxID=1499685 RepID=UPI000539C5AC|nr:YozE family protein [Bacillus andreraoultii]
MGKSFYHFLMRYRNSEVKKRDELANFAENAFRDHGFPKNSSDYDELSRYLEMNGDYLPTMTIFDHAWDLYKSIENK